MHEKVKAFIDSKIKEEQEKAKAEAERQKEERERTLISLGLFEKEYSPNNEDSADYPCSEWDKAECITKYYKRVPVEVTDEEYLLILQYAKQPSAHDAARNSVATSLTGIAWFIFIAGLIAFIILNDTEGYVGLYCFISAFISGMLFLGFAEIIKLLEAIKRK